MSLFGLKFSQMILHTETSKLMYNQSFLFEVLHKPTLLPNTFNINVFFYPLLPCTWGINISVGYLTTPHQSIEIIWCSNSYKLQYPYSILAPKPETSPACGAVCKIEPCSHNIWYSHKLKFNPGLNPRLYVKMSHKSHAKKFMQNGVGCHVLGCMLQLRSLGFCYGVFVALTGRWSHFAKITLFGFDGLLYKKVQLQH